VNAPALVHWSGPLVYVEDVTEPAISSEDRHHLERVLRLRAGARLVVCDGRGSWREATLSGVIDAASEVFYENRPDPPIRLSVALPKGERADWLIQKVTEIGVDMIAVVEARHSVLRWGDRAARHLERLTRIMRSASAQSRRAWLPDLFGPIDYEGAISPVGSVVAHPGGGPIAPTVRNVVIGPEGGWHPDELSAAPATLGLGPQVLRVETAALVTSTLLVALRSRLVLPPTFGSENALGG
jgi:16S rRNA (uracil1498-N3)-methyltransferase